MKYFYGIFQSEDRFIDELRDNPQNVMSIFDEFFGVANWDQTAFTELYMPLSENWYSFRDEHNIPRPNDEIIDFIKEKIQSDYVFIADLAGYRNGGYREQPEGDSHFVTILDYRDGYFLISDSDAPFNNVQGQFVWVSEEIIGQSFHNGNFIKLFE